MDFELVEKLRVSGFPHTRIKKSPIRAYASDTGEMFEEPTTDDLIAELPNEIVDNSKKRIKPLLNTYDTFHLTRSSQGWRAYYKNYGAECYPLAQVASKTPVEALANLYIELHSKA
jgi:hypothetical protein